MFDYVIVGAGFSGAVIAERIASQLKKKVLLIDKRNHIGGNCYDHYTEEGLLVHKYGPRAFHTPDKSVWDYLAKFTIWKSYQHKVLASVDGILIPVPFNLNAIDKVFPRDYANVLTNKLIHKYGYAKRVSIFELRDEDDKDLKQLAEFIYNKIYLNFTIKQWGSQPEELDSHVTNRMSVVISRDDRNSADQYQGIPNHGYNKLFKKMLDHENIKVMLNTDYREIITLNHHTKQIKLMGQVFEGKLIYTAKLDELFDYCYGELPYRTIDFTVKIQNKEHAQDVATINYPNEYDFTRVTEVKYLTGQIHAQTSIIEEYHRNSTRRDIPYYPIPKAENLAIHDEYKKLVAGFPNLSVVGHLADYRYYDMNVVVAMALAKFEHELNVVA